jgi:hypothetical protein
MNLSGIFVYGRFELCGWSARTSDRPALLALVQHEVVEQQRGYTDGGALRATAMVLNCAITGWIA